MKHDELRVLRDEIDDLKAKNAAREKKEVITEWLHTKCIWVWTLLLGWSFYAGVFLVEHYDKVAVAVIAAIRALKESSK